MADRLTPALVTLLCRSAVMLAPVACVTVMAPAIGHADVNPKCDASAPAQSAPPPNQPCVDQPHPQAQTVSCPDGTIVDAKNDKCVSMTEGIAKQLKALPAPPSLQGFGGGDGGAGGGDLGDLGGIPSLGTVNLPSVVLPSLGLNLVPGVNVNLQPQFPSFNPLNLPAIP
jgi:hypothetical protein